MKIYKTRRMERKASIMDIFVFLVIAVVVVVFLGLWIYGFNQLTTKLLNVKSENNLINLTDATQKTFGTLNTAQNTWLPIIAYAMIFGMILSIFITSFLEKVHPVFFIVYIFITIAAIVVSVYLSNFYEKLIQDPVIGQTFITKFKAGSFILLHLPSIVTIVGFIGGTLLLIGLIRDWGAGGSVV